jgi:Raf kinase inhibitor-like YbhB/YbcL family protein
MAMAGDFNLIVEGIGDGRPIPERHARCAPDGRMGGNISPAVSWSNVPEGALSLVLLMIDHDAAIDRNDVNKLGHVVAADTPRRDFYHWLLIDIPASATGIPEGETVADVRGHNDFGPYKSPNVNGYDGPCPPWNDERVHTYDFILHAIDVPSLRLEEGFTAADLETALAGHVLATARTSGVYSLNRNLVLS